MSKNKQKITALRFLYDNVKPYKFYLFLHLIVVIWMAIDVSLWPYVSKLLLDKIAILPKEEVIAGVWPEALLLIILTMLPALIWRICDFSWAKLTPRVKKNITSSAMEYVMEHSHQFFQNRFSGSLANKVRDLFNPAPKLLEIIIYQFFAVFLSALIAFFALLTIHKAFAFGLLIWAVLFTFMAIRSAKLTDRMSLNIARQQTKIMGNVNDVLSNIANVKFFASSKFESKRINNFQDKYTKLFERRGLFLVKFYLLHGMSFVLYFAACIVFLIYLYSKNLVTLGDFLMLFTINNYVIHLMWIAANSMRNFLEDLGTMDQALEMLNEPIELKDFKKKIKVKKGKIEFKDVKFSYKKDIPLFQGKSITIKPGEKVGLVGHSGGGKSTFINLILRLFDVDGGKILIDGQDISKVNKDSLRSLLGVIPQDPSLLHRNLFENIAYGATKIDKNKVIKAAKNAHADEFIKNLSEGYRSLVGERGIKLSGGQRQRIAIARAFFKDAPILILDEATSALDSVTENLIQESLKKLMKNKTTLVVAHRLSTLRIMDRIIVFDKGKIVEDGKHEDLLKLKGIYAKLWDSQVNGVLTNSVEKPSALTLWEK